MAAFNADTLPSVIDQETPPTEVSLFIGGKEFVLEGVGVEGGKSLLKALKDARTEIVGELVDPDDAARSHDMSREQVIEFLGERRKVLDLLIRSITPSTGALPSAPDARL